MIHGGNITAAGSSGAGIGAGYAATWGSDNVATSSVGTLIIYGGNVTATASTNAGIGAEYRSETGSGHAVSQAASILIFDGIIDFGDSLSGISAGSSTHSSPSNLTVWNGLFDCSALRSGVCFSASSLTFANGSTIALTNQKTVGTSAQTQISGSPELYFEYVSESLQEGLTSLPLLHFESIILPSSTAYSLTIREIGPSEPPFERTVQFDPRRSRGCAVSVSRIGNYTIFFNSTVGGISGRVGHDGNLIFPASGFYDNFYSTVSYYVPPTGGFDSTSLCSPSDLFSLTIVFPPDFRLIITN
jgi:hypothetical protein